MPKPPFIMLSNHGTFFDPWIVGHFSRYPLSIMMNEEGFKTNSFVRWYLKNIGTYPKKKGESDIRAMKYTMTTLKQGYPVLIFPEGQTTWDGERQPIYKGVESIIRRVKLPVVLFRLSGNFISKPWWCDTFRRGRVLVHRKILTPEYYSEMSKQKIRAEIIDFLYNNDLKSEHNKDVEFKGPAPIDGLTRFVWACMSCKKEDSLFTEKDALVCKSCGASWLIDNHFRFTSQKDAVDIGDLHDYSKAHKEIVKTKIAKSADSDLLAYDQNVQYCDVDEFGKYVIKGNGSLSLDKKKLVFTFEDQKQLSLLVEHINDYVFQKKDIFECRCNGEVYKFRFTSGSCMKWVYYFRYLNNYAECEQRGYI